MTRIGLVSCSKTKLTTPAPAFLMYSKSPRFTQLFLNAKRECDKVYILSAMYGCLSPDELIKPYDKYLGDMSEHEVKIWASSVYAKLKGQGDEWYSYLPSAYREPLSHYIDFSFILSGSIFESAKAMPSTGGGLMGCEGVMEWCIEYIYQRKTVSIEEIRKLYQQKKYAKATVAAQLNRLAKHPLLIRRGNFVRYKFL